MDSRELQWILDRARRYLEKTELRLDVDEILSDFALRIAQKINTGRMPSISGLQYWDGMGFHELQWAISGVLRKTRTIKRIRTQSLEHGFDIPESDDEREPYYEDWLDRFELMMSQTRFTDKQRISIHRRRYGIKQPPEENSRAATALAKIRWRVWRGT